MERNTYVQTLRGAAMAIALLSPLAAAAQEPGNVEAGFAFAEKNCAECHAVRKGQAASPNPDAPSFDSVARTRAMTGRALAVWLRTSHPTMPNFLIAQEDRDDVIAYIMSLKPAAGQ